MSHTPEGFGVTLDDESIVFRLNRSSDRSKGVSRGSFLLLLLFFVLLVSFYGKVSVILPILVFLSLFIMALTPIALGVRNDHLYILPCLWNLLLNRRGVFRVVSRNWVVKGEVLDVGSFYFCNTGVFLNMYSQVSVISVIGLSSLLGYRWCTIFLFYTLRQPLCYLTISRYFSFIHGRVRSCPYLELL